MRLTELSPTLLKYVDEKHLTEIGNIAEADGIMFECPKCHEHNVICFTPDVPASVKPGPGRWNLVGTSYDDLSLVAEASSVKLVDGCGWHGYVTNGEVTV